MRVSFFTLHKVALAGVVAAALIGCGEAYEHPHTTNAASTMRRANFDPSRCHFEGPSIYWCDNDNVNNTLSKASEQNNDAEVIRVPGVCRAGERFDQVKGCVDIDTGEPAVH